MTVRRERDGRVLRLTIDRPEQRNALNVEVLDGLVDGLSGARGDGDLRVVVLTGAGDRAFCAGADLASGMMDDGSALAQHDARGRLRDLFAAIDALDMPLVGRVNGHAIAGGFGLALGCDLLVAADHATFGTPEVNVGLWPFVISPLIVAHLGPKRASELMMTGSRIDARQAHEWGLVNRCVPQEELDGAVADLVEDLASGSPVALALGRRSLVQARDMHREAAMAYLHGMLDLAVQTEDVREGIQAFLEKRDPEWPGR